ncbi:MAG: hypothetical protein LUC35_03400, partial [Clostridiales bacterium]|nr:hypothetical protein [Clostridiales bacterium]
TNYNTPHIAKKLVVFKTLARRSFLIGAADPAHAGSAAFFRLLRPTVKQKTTTVSTAFFRCFRHIFGRTPRAAEPRNSLGRAACRLWYPINNTLAVSFIQL